MKRTAVLWDCAECGDAGVLNLGTNGYCPAHLAEVFAKFKSPALSNVGRGLGGSLAGQFGPNFRHLTCVSCGATWAGVIWSLCPWCLRASAQQLARQAEATLTAPDVDVTDERYNDRLAAWVERLRRAVDVGIIEESDAVHAVRRFAGSAGAA